VLILSLFTLACLAQSISPHWEELTAPDFVQALDQAKGVCLLPFGIIEKHGPSGPMGTDLINVRYATFEATKQEYAIVFPEYYFGQIFEAKHQPGTIAYSTRLQLELLQETTAEMARNGCKKVVIISGHGGNTNLIAFFAQTTLETPKDYVVYAITNAPGQAAQMPAAARPSKSAVDGHAGEVEIASVMASRPDLAHPERAGTESGADLMRLDLPANVYTGIWWYARFPNHYQGDASGATAARGAALQQIRADAIASAIRAIKADQVSPRLQKEFFDEATHPIDTKQ
jgi:creatinine amidohydrolase